VVGSSVEESVEGMRVGVEMRVVHGVGRYASGLGGRAHRKTFEYKELNIINW
jgi:hypothetical protein